MTLFAADIADISAAAATLRVIGCGKGKKHKGDCEHTDGEGGADESARHPAHRVKRRSKTRNTEEACARYQQLSRPHTA